MPQLVNHVLLNADQLRHVGICLFDVLDAVVHHGYEHADHQNLNKRYAVLEVRACIGEKLAQSDAQFTLSPRRKIFIEQFKSTVLDWFSSNLEASSR